MNYTYIDEDEKGYREIKEWISEPKFVSTWDKYYKKRLGLSEDIIEDVKLEMKKWKIEEKIEKETEKEISYFLTPENTVKTYYEAIFVKQDETLAERCWSQKTSPSLIAKVTSITKVKKQIEKEGFNFEDYPQKLSTVEYKAEDINNETCIVTVTFKEKPGKWKVIKEDDEWKIIMPAGLSKEEKKVWLKSTSEIQPFFDLSTPENTAKSFMETLLLKDNQKAKECWSNKIPDFLKEYIVTTWQESFFKEDETSETIDFKKFPVAIKNFLSQYNYEKEEIDENAYYVWFGFGEEKHEDPFRIVKENNEWKIRSLKSLEDNPLFYLQGE